MCQTTRFEVGVHPFVQHPGIANEEPGEKTAIGSGQPTSPAKHPTPHELCRRAPAPLFSVDCDDLAGLERSDRMAGLPPSVLSAERRQAALDVDPVTGNGGEQDRPLRPPCFDEVGTRPGVHAGASANNVGPTARRGEAGR